MVVSSIAASIILKVDKHKRLPTLCLDVHQIHSNSVLLNTAVVSQLSISPSSLPLGSEQGLVSVFGSLPGTRPKNHCRAGISTVSTRPEMCPTSWYPLKWHDIPKIGRLSTRKKIGHLDIDKSAWCVQFAQTTVPTMTLTLVRRTDANFHLCLRVRRRRVQPPSSEVSLAPVWQISRCAVKLTMTKVQTKACC